MPREKRAHPAWNPKCPSTSSSPARYRISPGESGASELPISTTRRPRIVASAAVIGEVAAPVLAAERGVSAADAALDRPRVRRTRVVRQLVVQRRAPAGDEGQTAGGRHHHDEYKIRMMMSRNRRSIMICAIMNAPT